MALIRTRDWSELLPYIHRKRGDVLITILRGTAVIANQLVTVHTVSRGAPIHGRRLQSSVHAPSLSYHSAFSCRMPDNLSFRSISYRPPTNSHDRLSDTSQRGLDASTWLGRHRRQATKVLFRGVLVSTTLDNCSTSNSLSCAVVHKPAGLCCAPRGHVDSGVNVTPCGVDAQYYSSHRAFHV